MKNFINNAPIITVLAGSHAYGNSTPESDVDIRGIVIAPSDIRQSVFNSFEQTESTDWLEDRRKNELTMIEMVQKKLNKPDLKASEVDCVLYDVLKAIRLITQNNPNMLELLFCDENDIVYGDYHLEPLRANRNIFLSLRLKDTYCGYAASQLGKIKRHRSYLLGDIPTKPTRAEYGLPEGRNIINDGDKILIEQHINKIIKSWMLEDLNLNREQKMTLVDNVRKFYCSSLECEDIMVEIELKDLAADTLGLPDNIRFALKQELKYQAAVKNYKSYNDWLTTRNPKRKSLEEKFGFDTKHASQLIRLSRMGVEALNTGKIIVKRPDAEELTQIKNGARTYEDICDESERLKKEMELIYKINPCHLPNEPDKDKVEKLYLGLISSKDF